MSYINQNKQTNSIKKRSFILKESVLVFLDIFPNKMAPNTLDEQVKTYESDIEAKDRSKLKNDGYLWQKVNHGNFPDHSVESNQSDSLTPDHELWT